MLENSSPAGSFDMSRSCGFTSVWMWDNATGQARRISFNVTGFTLPVNMVWTTPAEAVKAPGISGSAMEVQSFVQRVTMKAAIDVLEEQGRRAGLFPAVISSILDQLTVNTSYNPLQCAQVNVNPMVAPGTMSAFSMLFFNLNSSNDSHSKHLTIGYT
ncbi:hypothetical protein KIN20_029267 [Parelaphostrongylus tenuis]|uniref:Uncharacterized protein n=1 Tax=Parelaphostrongylus tenuis TaxID=148309 RepID=A0AAD5R2B1_PARTN|nr:hypothetical protein KIN20_029267 [Parelaphostrongylus tenuis]